MSKTQFDIPPELNKLLRIYVIEYDFKSREKAMVFILKNFLTEIYKNRGGKWLVYFLLLWELLES